MKNVFKFLGIITLLAVIGFSIASCGEEKNSANEISGTVTANEWGDIYFSYTQMSDNASPSCTFTTNLQSNGLFTINAGPYARPVRTYGGVKVKWTAKVENGKLSRSDSEPNSVAIVGN